MTTSAPLTIGAVQVEVQGTLHWIDGLDDIPAAFSARGQAETWALSLTSNRLTINVGGFNRRDLIRAWETSPEAITFVDGDDEFVVPGPDATGSTPGDGEEPYVWSWPTFSDFVTWLNTHKSSAALAIVLSDGAAPAATTVTASAGGDKSVASGGTVDLDGSATVENGVGATTWAWTRISGTGGSLDDATAQEPTFTAPTLQAGAANRTIVFELVATNNGVSSAGDRVTITVTAPGAPPPATTVTASAGGDKSVASGGAVDLDGSATVQNGQGATTWAWTRISGAGGSLDDATAQEPTFTAPTLQAGAANRTIVFELVATNNGVSSAGDRVTITVAAPALAAPVLSGTAGDGEVNVAWTAVPGATSYERRHKRTSSQNWGAWAAAEADRTQRFGGLVNGVSYDFQVRGKTSSQDGPPSNTLTLTPAAAGTPTTPADRDGVDAVSADAGTIVDLFKLTLEDGSVERYTTGPVGGASVRYGNQTYLPLPIALDGARFASSGVGGRPTLRVSNLGTVTDPGDWHGATVERTRTLARYLDGASDADSDRHFAVESWVVDRLSSQRRGEVVWQLSSPLDLEIASIPGRQVLRDVCGWTYRRRVGGQWVNPPTATGCPYRGSSYWNAEDESTNDPAEDRCSLRLSGCKLRFGDHGDLPFGGFAGVSRYRR